MNPLHEFILGALEEASKHPAETEFDKGVFATLTIVAAVAESIAALEGGNEDLVKGVASLERIEKVYSGGSNTLVDNISVDEWNRDASGDNPNAIDENFEFGGYYILKREWLTRGIEISYMLGPQMSRYSNDLEKISNTISSGIVRVNGSVVNHSKIVREDDLNAYNTIVLSVGSTYYNFGIE